METYMKMKCLSFLNLHCYHVSLKGYKVNALTEHHAMRSYWGSGGIAPRILDHRTRWRWAVSFTSRPLYPHGKSSW